MQKPISRKNAFIVFRINIYITWPALTVIDESLNSWKYSVSSTIPYFTTPYFYKKFKTHFSLGKKTFVEEGGGELGISQWRLLLIGVSSVCVKSYSF